MESISPNPERFIVEEEDSESKSNDTVITPFPNTTVQRESSHESSGEDNTYSASNSIPVTVSSEQLQSTSSCPSAINRSCDSTAYDDNCSGNPVVSNSTSNDLLENFSLSPRSTNPSREGPNAKILTCIRCRKKTRPYLSCVCPRRNQIIERFRMMAENENRTRAQALGIIPVEDGVSLSSSTFATCVKKDKLLTNSAIIENKEDSEMENYSQMNDELEMDVKGYKSSLMVEGYFKSDEPLSIIENSSCMFPMLAGNPNLNLSPEDSNNMDSSCDIN